MTEVVSPISELKQLLEKNAWSLGGLNGEELSRVIELLDAPIVSEENCWVCEMFRPANVQKAIFDTGLCYEHACRALVEKK